MSTPESKRSLRKEILAARAKLSAASVSSAGEKMVERLADVLSNTKITSLFLFHPYRNEPDLLALSTLGGWSVALPVVQSAADKPEADVSDDMEFFPWRKGESLVANKWGILEPEWRGRVPSIPDSGTAIVVPCLALDRNGIRLGYGGGYYDRFLSAYPECMTIGVVMQGFVYDVLPREQWDRPVSRICTEAQWLEV